MFLPISYWSCWKSENTTEEKLFSQIWLKRLQKIWTLLTPILKHLWLHLKAKMEKIWSHVSLKQKMQRSSWIISRNWDALRSQKWFLDLMVTSDTSKSLQFWKKPMIMMMLTLRKSMIKSQAHQVREFLSLQRLMVSQRHVVHMLKSCWMLWISVNFKIISKYCAIWRC